MAKPIAAHLADSFGDGLDALFGVIELLEQSSRTPDDVLADTNPYMLAAILRLAHQSMQRALSEAR